MRSELREVRPVLLENPEIRWPGFRVRRVALNQHMPRVERFSVHTHEFTQILLYLGGSGVQHLGREEVPVGRGSLLVIPPGRRHRFEKARQRRPVCLAVDLETGGELGWKVSSLVGPGALAGIERWLVALHEIRSARAGGGRGGGGAPAPPALSTRTASLILRIISRIEESAAPGAQPPRRGPAAEAVARAVAKRGLAGLGPGLLARELGLSLDHLNRRLRAETGATAGAALSRLRLEEARRLLRETALPVGEVGSAVGIDDQNYFARWFRRHAGESPTRWRRAMRGGA